MRCSVIIPAYNAESTLDEAIESVCLGEKDELIVIDDGSDKPLQAMGRVIRQPNQGAAAAINRGVSESRGEVLAFLDADDRWVEGKLERQLAALDGVDGVLGGVECFVCPTVAEERKESLHYPEGVNPGWLMGTLCVRKEAFEEVGPLDESLRTGYFIEWMERAKRVGLNFRMLEALVLERRIRPGTLSSSAHLRKDFLEIARRAIREKRG